ncbi:MAG: nucleoside 2-deoxyribosyltransferase [Chloroflexi bacterium]|nr:nucleoside 2-deoxyribosyltransferase [Chloroflexota bacterium]
MKIYFAGPLFTTPERTFNAELAARLEAAGHRVYLPQARGLTDDPDQPVRQPSGGEGSTPRARSMTPRQILEKNLRGLDWAEAVVAIMDGSDPDSGTAWECGYAYARRKPTVQFRSDIRGVGDTGGNPYNAMLTGPADAHIEILLGSVDEAADAILAALDEVAAGS